MADNCSWQSTDKSYDKVFLHSIRSGSIDNGYVSEFTVPKMDCPLEECMVRMSLETIRPSVKLEFDIPNRKVKVFHEDNLNEIQRCMESLNLGAILNDTRKIDAADFLQKLKSVKTIDAKEAIILKWLLTINATMFVIEFSVGWLAQSTALIADSSDMFADAIVYGVALYAVGRSVQLKLRVAHIKASWIFSINDVIANFGVILRRVFW